ncbi:MAG: serine hydrolase [Crocinitomicaceae bacterium]|nr:serine hydrolase [Crocinitomicaceae bacterium]
MKSIVFQLVCLLLITLSSCIPVKSVFLGRPDSKDQLRFQNSNIQAGEECFAFHQSEDDSLGELKISDWTNDIPFFVTLNDFVGTHKIRSLAIIQNDTLKYQYDADSFDESSLHPSYSIAKSFTSALIGIAIADGFIKDEQELVVKYVPELAGKAYSNQLTIEHLLNHTSGFEYNLSTDATIYYGRNSLKTLDKLKFKTVPGTKQHYLNINVHLLGLILKRATNIPPSKYLEDKIWKPIGMCTDGEWSIDKVNQQERAFCCLGATTLDYAKFGRLYLNKGVWNGKQVISESWYNKSIKRATTNGSSFNYNYCWHIGLKEYGDFMAIGLYKQHIYINPKKNLIIVLLNEDETPLKAERVNWWFVFRQIADQL